MNKGKATARKPTGKRAAPPRAANSPPRKKKKTKGKKRAPPPPEESESEEVDYEDITDPAKIDHPVLRLVHRRLKDGWAIDNENPMCFIFDKHSPARHFKRGVSYREKKDFRDYGKPPYDDLTETDGGPSGLMPFTPWAVKCVD